MTKYAILHGNYNIYHAEFDSYEEAKEYYDHLIKVEGDLDDLQLCKILETHEAPERDEEVEMPAGGRHYYTDYGVGMDEVHKNWMDNMRKLNDNWMNSRR